MLDYILKMPLENEEVNVKPGINFTKKLLEAFQNTMRVIVFSGQEIGAPKTLKLTPDSSLSNRLRFLKVYPA